VLPGPAVHPDFASLAALPPSDEHSAAGTVEIALLEGERLADPHPRTPEQEDQRPETVAVRAIANRPHDGDDLLDRRRVGGILLALVARRAPSVVASAATVIDPEGREVVLLARIWEDKIARDHPELVDHLEAVIETVAKPDHIEADVLPDRRRFYRRNVGPSRWLMVVVSYEQQQARVTTALANRGDPKRWKP